MPIFHVHITLLFLLENGPQILILVFRQKIKDCASFTFYLPPHRTEKYTCKYKASKSHLQTHIIFTDDISASSYNFHHFVVMSFKTGKAFHFSLTSMYQ